MFNLEPFADLFGIVSDLLRLLYVVASNNTKIPRSEAIVWHLRAHLPGCSEVQGPLYLLGNTSLIQSLRAFRWPVPFVNGRVLVVHRTNKEIKKCPDSNTSVNAITRFVVLKGTKCD